MGVSQHFVSVVNRNLIKCRVGASLNWCLLRTLGTVTNNLIIIRTLIKKLQGIFVFTSGGICYVIKYLLYMVSRHTHVSCLDLQYVNKK